MDNQTNPVKSSQSEFNGVNPTNSNKNFLIIAIIVGIIAVGAGGFILGKYYNDISKEATKVYESGEDASKITEKETGKCASIQNISEKNQCWIELAKEEKDENHCKKISTDFPEAKGDCYTELAILKDDSLICEKIDSSSSHKSCLEYFEENDEKDETADWEVYENTEYGFEFKYPKGWFTYERIETNENRVYVQTVSGEVNKETAPSDFKRIWIAYDNEEADRNPAEFSETKKAIVVNNGISMNYYEWSNINTKEPTMEAYWANNSVKYMADCASEIGRDNSKQEVVALKKILSTFKFTD